MHDRRAVDRAEARVLRLELEMMNNLNRYGSSSFDQAITLSMAYVDRAKERKQRGTATEEDLKIIGKAAR